MCLSIQRVFALNTGQCNSETTSEINDSLQSNDFLKFWTLYRRKEAKGYAYKAWRKIDSSLFEKIYSAAAEQSKSWAFRGTELRYIPLPASWLNGEYYLNEQTTIASVVKLRPCVVCGKDTEGLYSNKPFCGSRDCHDKITRA